MTGDRIAKYVDRRRQAGKEPGTVNRELAALKRALALAVDHDRLAHVPTIKMLTEHNARQGFISPADFEAIVVALPRYLQDFARFGYLLGWRVSEIARLEWADVDRDGQRLTLRRELSKNAEPNEVPFIFDLAELIGRRWAAREYHSPSRGSGIAALVFHRAGRRIGDFRYAWRKACRAAGHPNLLFHDLRRSAVRNLMDASVDQAVAMRITGHKTASIFRRYRIVNNADVKVALERVAAANRVAVGKARTVVPLRPAQDA